MSVQGYGVMKHVTAKILSSLTLGLTLSACSGNNPNSYSILATGQSFKQATVNSKVDLLWVIDNSRSMLPLQNNLTTNFNSFITGFVNKGYDYRIATTGSDAYLAGSFFNNDPSYARFRDGTGTTRTGVYVITPATLNPINTFTINATIGASSSGDERAFSSFRETLNAPANTGFLRLDSFLGVIILSDEDDFSNPTRAELDFSTGDKNYNQAGLESVDTYVSYLEGLTNSAGAKRRFNVSSIAVLDEACRAQHAVDAPSTSIGYRYMELANKTKGVLGSVCDASFSTALENIQKKIIELSSQFYLGGEPVVETIRVVVNDLIVPQDADNGWTYDAAANSVVFHGAAVPPSGANISVAFDPVKVVF
jgi:hypothetical protein